MESIIKCSCGRNELPIHSYKFGCYHIECDFCRKESHGMPSPELAIQAWNNMMREEYLKPHKHDELYKKHFKTKKHKDEKMEKKDHLCDTCQHQIRGTDNGCRKGNHEQGVVCECRDYEYYGPSRQDIDEALADAGKPKQVGGDHYSRMKIQPWDAMESWMSNEQFTGFLLGSAIAYLGRFNATTEGKGGRQDIEKAKHYLEKLLEVIR